MKVIYVAGPYRSDTEFGLKQNIRNAEAVAIKAWQAGHVAFCPHKNTAHFGGLCPDEIWLAGGLEMLRRCDAMVLVQGWEKSSGTLAEIKEAEKYNIPVYKSVDGLM